MKHRPVHARRISAHLVLLLIAMLCTACAVEGGIPETPTRAPGASPAPQPTDAAHAAAITARNQIWTIALTDQPASLSPYQATATDQRRAAAVTELLFPSPVLAQNYTYTTTGVLARLPTIENGDATLRKADVFLDAAGAITTTATQVITQADQLVITYHWNPALHWSDGRPVTAADSVFAYEHAKATPASDEVQSRLARLISYTAVDDHTTQAVLRPDYVGPTYFLNYWTPLPGHVLKGATPARWQAFDDKPLGYGPYAIATREDAAIRMVRNPYYFGAPPPNPKLDILFGQNLDLLRANIANGNLDVIATDRLQIDDIKQIDADAQGGAMTAAYAPTPIWEHIDFNLDVPALQSLNVRRAIAFGTNRTQIAQDLLGGHASVLDSWVLPGQPEAAPPDQLTRYDYNPDAARKLLEDAGYTDADGDGIRSSGDGLTLTLQLLTTADSPLREAIATHFKADMRAIGIKVDLVTSDAAAVFALEGPLYQRQFEMALFGWKAEPNAGGLSLWNCNAVPAVANNFVGENFAGWCFRPADTAIRRGATTLALTARKDLYLKQQQFWTQELPALPLFQRVSVVMTAAGIQGPQADTFAPVTWNVGQWQRR